MRRVSRGAVFWGSAFITAGLVVLAIQQGLVNETLLGNIGQWWPLFLIGAGVAIIFAGTLGVVAVALSGILLGLLVGGFVSGAASFPVGCGGENPGDLVPVESGELRDGSDVDIDLNCADLALGGEDGSRWSVEADDSTAGELEFSASDDELRIQTDEDISSTIGDRGGVAVTLPLSAGANVSVGLNAASAELEFGDGRWGVLDLEGNAVDLRVDLSGAEAESVELGMNAGSAAVQLTEETDLAEGLRFETNAGSISVCAPEGLGLAITLGDDITVGHNLEDEGLDQDGDVWRTPGFASADAQLEIAFDGNAASFTLNPSGGCA